MGPEPVPLTPTADAPDGPAGGGGGERVPICGAALTECGLNGSRLPSDMTEVSKGCDRTVCIPHSLDEPVPS